MIFILSLLILTSSKTRSRRPSIKNLDKYVSEAAKSYINEEMENEMTNDMSQDGSYQTGTPGSFDNSECQCFPCQAPMSPLQVTEMQNIQNKIYAQQAQLAQLTTLANKVTDQFKRKATSGNRMSAPGGFDDDMEGDDEDMEDDDAEDEDENADNTFTKAELRRMAKLLNKEMNSKNNQQKKHRHHRSHRRSHRKPN